MRTSHRVSAAVAAAVALCLGTPVLAAAPLGNGLRDLSVAYDKGDRNLTRMLKPHLTNRVGDPVVKVRIADGADAQKVLASLTAAGFQFRIRSTINPALVEGTLPLASVHRAANVSGLHSIQAEFKPTRHAGSVQSQAVALEKADLAQKHGYDGKGIRIAALSDSYDGCVTCTIHAADDVKSGDLPKDVFVLEDDTNPADGVEDEGRAMLQLIHDIAPAAKLGFATANIGEVEFAENILALRKVFHADVIVDDIYYYDEPFFSDGLLAQAVNLVVEDGAAYFSSAGNNGLLGYEATYNPVSFSKAKSLIAAGHGNIKLDQIPAALRPQSIHNYGGIDGPSFVQHISVPGDNIIDFQWDEPFYLGKVKTDYNIYLFDKDGNWLDPATAPTAFYTTDDNTQTDAPLELMETVPFPDDIVGAVNISDYQIVIGSMNGGPAKHIKYQVENNLVASDEWNAPTTGGHAAATKAIGVAATYYPYPDLPEDFSSPGPVTIYLDENGDRLKKPEVRFVPQITAADGVDTTFFIAGDDPDGDGLPNFFGTSAAAPDAAAVAGLVLQAAGGPGKMKPADIYKRLEQTATRMPTPEERGVAGTISGPVFFDIQGPYTRWSQYFRVNVPILPGKHWIKSITLDAKPTGLTFNPNLNRFGLGETHGVKASDMTPSVSSDTYSFTLTFKDKSLGAGDCFTFGESVFLPLEGSTQLDPDRFRNMKILVTLDNGQKFSAPVLALPKQSINNFTGYGLVNADAATRGLGH